MGFSEWDLFYIDGLHRKFLSGHHTLFIPNIPKFHYSIGYRSENIAFAGIAKHRILAREAFCESHTTVR